MTLIVEKEDRETNYISIDTIVEILHNNVQEVV